MFSSHRRIAATMVALGLLTASAGCGLMLSYSDYETAVGGGGSGAAGGGGTGATGGYGPEDCLNGVDDDGDGDADCADTEDCAAASYQCVEVPAGWRGPLVGFPGVASPPPCTAPYAAAEISTMQYPGIGWAACGCRCAPTAPNCLDREVQVNMHPYTSDNCTDTPCPGLGSSNELSVPPGAGECTAPGSDLLGDCTLLQIRRWEVEAPGAPPVQGGCAPVAVALASEQPPITSASWQTLEGRACELPNEPSAAGCDATHRCVPRAQDGASYCIIQDWTGGTPPIDCPAPYNEAGVLLFNGPTPVDVDGRGCRSAEDDAACQCTAATSPLEGHCVGGKVNIRAAAGQCGNADIQRALDVDSGQTFCTPGPAFRVEYDPTNMSFDPTLEDPCAWEGQAVADGGVTFEDDPVYLVCCAAPPED